MAIYEYWVRKIHLIYLQIKKLHYHKLTNIRTQHPFILGGYSFKCFALVLLKLPSLFAEWLVWTFHTKSHNMKAWVILSHSWSSFLPLTCGKMNFCGSLCGLLEYFLEKKTPLRLPMQITWPWPPEGRFNHGLITIKQRKMWT